MKRVFMSAEYPYADYEKMVNLHYNFIKQYNIDYCFIDGSQLEFISSLKGKLGEETEYEHLIGE